MGEGKVTLNVSWDEEYVYLKTSGGVELVLRPAGARELAELLLQYVGRVEAMAVALEQRRNR